MDRKMFLALARYDLGYLNGEESLEEYIADMLEQLYKVCPDTKESIDETVDLFREEFEAQFAEEGV
mgnify:CR=1 FL=1